ncbi:ABC transporter substrate-binding protein [Phytomonospora endophytica]|uniref:Multiple sugar transport system substrate-binding protein n=1 Tax=Phytomonospora endophytica TaxID=714109 RepID=A0A841FKP0_9ACTN|nr:sugar ABC transporter substrate-binding protein [Phytomonospora endophytica]MBB6037901.1 multiple sugar transport system substrate-binding protein [Phytomonospora endophytica]GIG68801.1 sugar ABC transporter substrate-binding protein [Phytomonospora endophytica]
MRTARKLVSALALGTVALAAGCGGQSDPDDVALRMSVWTSNEDQLALFNTIADAYKATHPEITSITFESLPFAEYNTTLTTQIAGGNAPDLAWMGDLSADLIDAGALVPLTEPLKATADWGYDDLLPSATAEFSHDGNLYAYPFSNSPFALYVNTDLLDDAGQKLPAQPTWDDISSIGAAVHAKTGKGGFVINDFAYSSWNTLATVWTGFGASAWNADGTQCGFTSPEMTAAFEFIHRAAFVDESMPGPGITADFFAGDAAFAVAQVSRAGLLDGSFAYDVQPLPQGPAGTYSVIGQAGMGVLKSSDHTEAATGFLAFLTNPENAAKLAQYFPPPRTSLLSGDALAANNTKFSPEQLQAVVVDQIADAVTLPNHTSPAEIAQKAKTELDAMWNPDADVPAVLTSVCAAIDPLLAE